MKRKLGPNDVPQPAVNAKADAHTFETLGLDSRLLRAVATEGFSVPTPVQQEVIPLALEGKDIFARARTGSGKTAAYVLPTLEAILRRKKGQAVNKATAALILVPTRELAYQVSKVVTALAAYCHDDVRHVNLMQKVSQDTQRSMLSSRPDIVICTPARAIENISSDNLGVQNLTQLIIDEADLVLSYGHDNDLKRLSDNIPFGVQKIFTSATLSRDVHAIKDMLCESPVLVELDDGKDDTKGLSQYYVRCAEDDKFLFGFVIFKLKLVKGKCIIFVGDTDRSYRLKLFFEQFGIRSCVLNAELPVNSRVHVVEEFDKNVYDIIIAADDHEVLEGDQENQAEDFESGIAAETGTTHQKPATHMDVDRSASSPPSEIVNRSKKLHGKPRRESGKKSKEYGVSRGIDFKNVACIVNFDMPTTSDSYMHRIGRTARAGKSGMALSFVVPTDEYHKSKATSFLGSRNDEQVLVEILAHQESVGQAVKPYQFSMKQTEAFRYRMNDALRAVTSLAIRQARTQEIRRELLKSEKLKRHFEEHPDDLNRLRHDGEIRAVRIQQHLKHVPDYLLPESGANGIIVGESKSVFFNKSNGQHHKKGKRSRFTRNTDGQRRRDPLRSFSTKHNLQK